MAAGINLFAERSISNANQVSQELRTIDITYRLLATSDENLLPLESKAGFQARWLNKFLVLVLLKLNSSSLNLIFPYR